MKILGLVPALEVVALVKHRNSPYSPLWDAVAEAPEGSYVKVAVKDKAENKRLLAALYNRRKDLRVVHAGLEHFVARNHVTHSTKGGN